MAGRKNGAFACRLQYHNSHLTNVSTRRSSPSVEMVIAPHSLVRQTRAFVVRGRASASGCGCPKGLIFATEITACRGFTFPSMDAPSIADRLGWRRISRPDV